MTASLDRVLTALEEVLPEGIGREYADILWLAGWLLKHLPADDVLVPELLPRIEMDDEVPAPIEPPSEDGGSEPPRDDDDGSADPLGESADPWINVYSQGSAAVSSQRRAGRTFRAPMAEALPARLALVRSLRPLMRRVPSRTAWQLAEEETVQRIAEGDIWMPLMRPAPERWFQATLVVDASMSMSIWRETALELRDLLVWSGAFRELRMLQFVADGDEPQLESAPGRPAAITRCQPGRKHLILVLSDCVSKAWWNGEAFRLLRQWSKGATVALLQSLPEPLWARTALGGAQPVKLKSRFSAPRNDALDATAFDEWDPVELRDGLRLPVAVLEPASFGALARLVAGPTGNWSAGVVVSDNGRRTTPEAARSNLTAIDRVRQFRQAASPLAQRLAGLIAASPVVSLQVIRHIRHAMLPDARQIHEAEFLLGGLMYAKPSSDDDLIRDKDIAFAFFDGVAELLLDSVPVPAWLTVLSRVSECLERRLGELGGFRAFLEDPTGSTEDMEVSDHPFVRLAASRLARLGGPYARVTRGPGRRVDIGRPGAAKPDASAVAAAPDTTQAATPTRDEDVPNPSAPPTVADDGSPVATVDVFEDPIVATTTTTDHDFQSATDDASIFDVSADAADLATSDSSVDLGGLGDSEIRLNPSADSEIRLTSDSDVLLSPAGGSGISLSDDADISLGAGDSAISLDAPLRLANPEDSGISLTNPDDSGISLESGSGISLRPADSGLSLEESDFELTLDDTPAAPVDTDSEFELTLDDSPPAAAKPDSEFELTLDDEPFEASDFELSLDEGGSQVVSLDDDDGDDFQLTLDDESDDEESGSQVVALDELEDDELDDIAISDKPRGLDHAVKMAQEFVQRGEFEAARQVVQELPNSPADLVKAKQSWLSQIDEVESSWDAAVIENRQLQRAIARVTQDPSYLDQVANQTNIDRGNAIAWNGVLKAIAKQLGIPVAETSVSASPATTKAVDKRKSSKPSPSSTKVAADPSAPSKRADCTFSLAGLPNSGKTTWLVSCYYQLRQRQGPRTIDLAPQSDTDSRFDACSRMLFSGRSQPATALDVPAALRMDLRGQRRWTNLWRTSDSVIELLDTPLSTEAGDLQRWLRTKGLLYFIDVSGGARGDDLARPLESIARFLRQQQGADPTTQLPVSIAICLTKLDLLPKRRVHPVSTGEIEHLFRATLISRTAPDLKQIKVRSNETIDQVAAAIPGWPTLQALCRHTFRHYQVFPMSTVGLVEGLVEPIGVLEPLLWLLHVNGYPTLE